MPTPLQPPVLHKEHVCRKWRFRCCDQKAAVLVVQRTVTVEAVCPTDWVLILTTKMECWWCYGRFIILQSSCETWWIRTPDTVFEPEQDFNYNRDQVKQQNKSDVDTCSLLPLWLAFFLGGSGPACDRYDKKKTVHVTVRPSFESLLYYYIT